MKKIIVFFLAIFLLSCDEEILYDKEVRLYFNLLGGIGGCTTAPMILLEPNYLRHFNKKNYPNIKTITFTALIKGENSNKNIIELYNVTDGIVVEKSLISTSSLEHTWVDSEDILNSLPEKEIDLSISMRSENAATSSCEIIGAELILKRD